MKSHIKFFSINLYSLSVAIVAMLFIYLTGSKANFWNAVAQVDANDVFEYVKMSKVAPSFPTNAIAPHFAQRFIIHYLIGCTSQFFRLTLENTYIIFNGLMIFLIFFYSIRLILKRTSELSLALILFSIFAFSPFSFRLNVMVPGLIADLLFVLGMIVALDGINDKKILKIFLGMLLAVIGKQIAILILPGILFLCFKSMQCIFNKLRTYFFTGSLGFVVIAFWKFQVEFTKSFSLDNRITVKILLSIFPWLFSSTFSVVKLFEHLFRIFVPLFPFIVILIFLSKNKFKKMFTTENIGFLLVIIGPMTYAFLPGPIVQMGNQSRYVGYALLPCLLLTLNIIPTLNYKFTKYDFLILGILLITFTYNHRYCLIQSSPAVFILIHLLSIVFLVFWIKHVKRKSINQYNQ